MAAVAAAFLMDAPGSPRRPRIRLMFPQLWVRLSGNHGQLDAKSENGQYA